LILICGAVLLLCQAIYSLMRTQPIGSVWMPRYLGMTWPAFAIALCVLACRLPGRALRWAFIGLLLIVNLKQFASRIATNFNVDPAGRWIITGSEPPIDLMAQDLIDSDTPRSQTIGKRTIIWSPASHTRVYAMNNVVRPPGPGYGFLGGAMGRYELSMAGLMSPESSIWPIAAIRFPFNFDRNTNPQYVARDVSRHPRADRVIVWDTIAPNSLSRPDLLIRRLGRDWELVSDERFEVMDHWRWLKISTARRREYRRRAPTVGHLPPPYSGGTDQPVGLAPVAKWMSSTRPDCV
jgi:hypothetical protein